MKIHCRPSPAAPLFGKGRQKGYNERQKARPAPERDVAWGAGRVDTVANIFDYLEWRGDLRFDQAPFTCVDDLILCRLSYVPFDGVVPPLGEGGAIPLRRAAERLLSPAFARQTEAMWARDRDLLRALAASARFGEMPLWGYVNDVDADEQKQFSALCALPGDGTGFAAFRGTDNTLVGWKEDFNMGFATPVPAQREAVSYLCQAVERGPASWRVGGHSKGGNLAVYAAAFAPAPVQERLLWVQNNDGPGFDGGVLEGPGYRAVRERVHTYLPQSSVVGMLLEHEEAYTVVHSGQVGLMQHDLYSWEVKGPGFVCLDEVSASSKFIDKTLKDWVAGMSREERATFFDTLYQLLAGTQAKTVGELSGDWLHSAGAVLQSLKNVDEDTRRLMGQVMGGLFRSARENLRTARPRGEGPERRLE